MQRLWNKVEIKEVNQCWPWKGAADKTGRGLLRVEGKSVIVTHLILKQQGKPRPLPPGDNALHLPTCKPSCCNPEHLRWGTQMENMQDMLRAGRSAGSQNLRNYHSHLSDNDVRFIRASAESNQILAKQFNLHPSTVWKIKTHKTFKTVLDEDVARGYEWWLDQAS